MPTGYPAEISEDDLKNVVVRLANGESLREMAPEFSLTPGALYQRVHHYKRRVERAGGEVSTTLQTPEEQMEALTKDYTAKMRALIVKQVLANLRQMG